MEIRRNLREFHGKNSKGPTLGPYLAPWLKTHQCNPNKLFCQIGIAKTYRIEKKFMEIRRNLRELYALYVKNIKGPVNSSL